MTSHRLVGCLPLLPIFYIHIWNSPSFCLVAHCMLSFFFINTYSVSTQKNRANEYGYIIYRMKDKVTTAIGMHIVTMPSYVDIWPCEKKCEVKWIPPCKLSRQHGSFFSQGDDLIRKMKLSTQRLNIKTIEMKLLNLWWPNNYVI